MSRLVTLGVLATALTLTGCTPESAPRSPAERAEPQTAQLRWREQASESGATLVFRVERLQVTDRGWEAEVSIENTTSTSFAIPRQAESADRAFGVMLFADGSLETLEEQSRDGTVPPVRQAQTTSPPTPAVLEPGTSWRGTLAAPGPLPAGAWLRVSLGPFTPVENPPDDMPPGTFSWITDHAYRLR